MLNTRQREELKRALNEAHSQIDRLGNRGKWERRTRAEKDQRTELAQLEGRIKRIEKGADR